VEKNPSLGMPQGPKICPTVKSNAIVSLL